jgi:hypothetical protein
VSITQPLIKQYKANLNAYCLALKDYLTRRGGTYLFTSTAVPFDTLVLNYLRDAGVHAKGQIAHFDTTQQQHPRRWPAPGGQSQIARRHSHPQPRARRAALPCDSLDALQAISVFHLEQSRSAGLFQRSGLAPLAGAGHCVK